MPENKQETNVLKQAQVINEGLKFICFDIETGFAAPEDIDKMIRDWKAPANIKDQFKIKERFEEFKANAKSRSALLDRAPITVLAMVTDGGNIIFSDIADPCPVKRMPGVDAEIRNFASERDLLLNLREYLDKNASASTTLVGFNCLNFDLPRVRNAYIRQKLAIPTVFLQDSNEVYDVMKKFLRGFTTEFANDRYVTLKEVQNRLGLPEYKEAIGGADAPRLAAEGKSKLVIPYCYLDAVTTWYAFLFMTGQVPDERR